MGERGSSPCSVERIAFKTTGLRGNEWVILAILEGLGRLRVHRKALNTEFMSPASERVTYSSGPGTSFQRRGRRERREQATPLMFRLRTLRTLRPLR